MTELTDKRSVYETVTDYYTNKVLTHGPTAKGVDWKDESSQNLRFDQLLNVVDGKNGYTLCDWGCGYGALLTYIKQRNLDCHFVGYDFSEEMIEQAQKAFPNERNCAWVAGQNFSQEVDYTIASGIFNVKLNESTEVWEKYIHEVLRKINSLSKSGFSFNMLTSYSDKDRMRPDLYYASPTYFFDLCKREFSRHVALLHDYGLYEFTIIVRKGDL